jgi:hypothetical protein
MSDVHFTACNVPDSSPFLFEVIDFVLIIQTKTMHENLQKFGNELISVDATHNTTCFGFKLITCFVVDPHGNCGLPVLFTIASGESGKYMHAMFTTMKVISQLHSASFRPS